MDGFSENILCKRENVGERKKDGDTVGSEAAQAVGVLHGVKKTTFFERKCNWIPIQNWKSVGYAICAKGRKRGRNMGEMPAFFLASRRKGT